MKNDETLFHFEDNLQGTFRTLTRALAKVEPGITFEFGPIHAGKREFILSANGERKLFPAVEKLHSQAPVTERWHFTKFRPRRPVGELTISIGNITVKPSDVAFTVTSNKPKQIVAVILYLKGYAESNPSPWNQIGALYLDQALGEFDVATKARLVALHSADDYPDLPHMPIANLAAVFDEVWASIQSTV